MPLPPHSRVAPALGVALLALGAAPSAPAAIHACPTPDGGVQFQDRPCSHPERKARTAGSGDGAAGAPASARLRRAPPLGIDPSWFEPPAANGREALCDSRGCECGSLERTFEAGITAAVADALYLDGAWHRYELGAIALGDPDADPALAASARTELEDAACDVLMSQQTLHRHAEAALRTLRRRAADARDLGRDTPDACDGFSESACRDYEALVLYRRVMADARALAEPRDSSLADGGAFPDDAFTR